MKFLKTLFSLILSILLALCVVLTCFVYKAQEVIKPENIKNVMSNSAIGEKILGYQYLDENIKEEDFYTFLCNNIQEPSALVLDFSLDKAKTCHEAALEYIKDIVDSNCAYTNMNKLAQDLTDGYCKAAVEKGLINPNSNITYRTQKAWLTKKRGVLLDETIRAKYQEYLEKMIADGNICSLDIDQKSSFAYMLRTGKAGATTQNEIYKVIEDQADRVCAEALSNYVNDVVYNTNNYKKPEKNEVITMVSESIFGYFHLNGINDDDVRNGYVERIIKESSESFIYPKIASFLLSYDQTTAQLPDYVSKLLPLLTNRNVLYGLIGVCVLLGVLLILINKKKSLLYIGISLIIAGAALYALKPNHLLLLDRFLYSNIKIEDVFKGIINSVTKTIIDNNTIAIALSGVGLLMSVSSFILRTKKG